jgi:hypothetical protein
MKRAKTFFLLKIFLAVSIAATILSFNFRDRILVSIVERITGVGISYSTWKGNPFRSSVVSSADLRFKKTGVGVRAEKIFLNVDLSGLITERIFSVECSLLGVIFFFEEKDPGEVTNVLNLISSSGQIFDSVDFTLISNGDSYSVKSFSAVSSDIIIRGDVFFDKLGKTISIDISFSVSPLLVSGSGENLKDRILSLQDDGWFGTTISYKGNPDFLRALYFTVVPGA